MGSCYDRREVLEEPPLSLGPVMLDLAGPALSAEERELLLHPLAGGVVLFSRNYEDPLQLSALTETIHGLRSPPLLIAVDHEGGRVQRFRGEFTALPPCGCLGRLHDSDPAAAERAAEQAGWLMASELLAVGVDFSFAPVLDVDHGVSAVIGDRSFHRDPETVARLARRYLRGMKRAGMEGVGKHFPGHGGVAADSHLALPVDGRGLEEMAMADLVPFDRLIRSGLAAVMTAHVAFPAVDQRPAGFSEVWLRRVLRERLRFSGAVFSDDISMAGAEAMGDYATRAAAALEAGCDMVLVCNNPMAAAVVLERLESGPNPAAQVRLVRMHAAAGRPALRDLKAQQEWKQAAALVARLDATPELGLGDDRT
jgi:beta-N-acetylhexosaminidase